jgi:hypothetical protein
MQFFEHLDLFTNIRYFTAPTWNFGVKVHSEGNNTKQLPREGRRASCGLVDHILVIVTAPSRERPLAEVVSLFTGEVCRDPRDHTYGMLGLVDHAADFGVDYEESFSNLYEKVLEHDTRNHNVHDVNVDAFSEALKSAIGLLFASLSDSSGDSSGGSSGDSLSDSVFGCVPTIPPSPA